MTRVPKPKPKPKPKVAKVTKRRSAKRASTKKMGALRLREIESLRDELAGHGAEEVPRWNADPDDARRSVAQLVLALIEFLRKLLERQAIRRMENDTLSEEEVERIGLALMRLEETVHELASKFDLDPTELNLDLGPLGRLT